MVACQQSLQLPAFWGVFGGQGVPNLMSRPRLDAGAVSAMYAGAACMARPMPSPYSMRPTSSQLRPGAVASAAVPRPASLALAELLSLCTRKHVSSKQRPQEVSSVLWDQTVCPQLRKAVREGGGGYGACALIRQHSMWLTATAPLGAPQQAARLPLICLRAVHDPCRQPQAYHTAALR